MNNFNNLDNSIDEHMERIILKKYGFPVNSETIIAFRSMLAEGLNSIEDLKEMISFVRCFKIYLFRTNDINLIMSDTLNQWLSSYEYDGLIKWDLNNFYMIQGHIYYIEW